MIRFAVRCSLLLAVCSAFAFSFDAANGQGKMPKDWRVFAPQDFSFSVWVPTRGGQEIERAMVFEIPNSKPLRINSLVYQTRVGADFQGLAFEIPKLIAQQINAKQWEESTRDAYIEKGKRKLVDFKDGELSGIAGKEYLVQEVKDKMQFTRIQMITIGENYLYIAAVFGTEGQVHGDDAKIFFDSYKIPARVAKLVPADKKAKPKKDKNTETAKEKGKALDKATLDKLLAALKSSDPKARQDAAEQLAKAAPVERREEVAKILTEQMTDSNTFVLGAVSKALGVWGGKETVPAMVALLTHDNKVVRGRAMEVLAALKDEAGAEPLAKRLEKTADRAKASQSLQDMGSVAEPAVIKRLKYPVADVRLEACKILKVIGTKASVAALQGLSSDSSAQVAKAAQEALSTLESR